MLCSCLVRNEKIHFCQVYCSNGHFAFSAGICYSTNLKDKLQTQHEVCSVKAVPYGRTWKSMPKLLATACFLHSLTLHGFLQGGKVKESTEKAHWTGFKCSNDWRWHLTDDFNVKAVPWGKFSLDVRLAKRKEKSKPLNPRLYIRHLFFLWWASNLIEQQVWVNCRSQSCNLFSWTKSRRKN